MRDPQDAREEPLEVRALLHDLRTPLMALLFLGEDLRGGAEDPVALGAQVHREAERLLRMVRTTGIDHPERPPGPTDLVTLAEDALVRARRAARYDGGHHIIADLPDRPLLADVDPDAALRALSNLLANARAYSADGTTIHLSVRDEAGMAVLAVGDEGMGIDADDLPRVVDPLFRAPAAVAAGVEGTGLGLAVVRRVADAHGGELEVASVVGEGSTFTLRLPLAG